MKRTGKIIAIVIIVLIAAILLGYKMYTNMDEKDYYVVGCYPKKVNFKVKELNYKVIGKYKLWNPNPRKITYEDVDIIKKELHG